MVRDNTSQIIGCTVYILNEGRLHMIFNSLRKTDKEDALQIAKFIQRTPEGELPTVVIPSDQEMAVRSSVAEQMTLDRSRTQSLNVLYNLLWNNGIDKEKRTDKIRYPNFLRYIKTKQEDAYNLRTCMISIF